MKHLSEKEANKLLSLFDTDAPDAQFPATAAVEFPLGEMASEDAKVRMILGFAYSDGLIRFPLPITGKEQFAAQGLEGKARLTATGKRAIAIYAMLPRFRRALYA